MADTPMHDDDGDAPALFFAGSDDSDREDTAMNVDLQDEENDEGAFTERKEGSEPLFLGGDSDDDEPPAMSEKAKGKRPMPDEICEVSSDSDIEVSSVVGGDLPRASSVSSFSDHVSIASDSSPPRKSSQSRQPPPKKKQRLSSPVALSEAPAAPSASLTPTYIGEFLIPNAWANVSGKGYAQVNDIVDIKRDENKPPPAKSKVAPKSKTSGKKQISIATMFKPQPAQSSSKKKPDTIVRLVNKKGFAFGRLPVETSSWIAHLLDLNVVELRGKMTDCPEKLTTGASLIVTVDVYMLPTAFQSVAPSKEKLMFNEGAETQEEINLRDRKTGLLKLFDVIGLKPHAGANVKLSKADEKLPSAAKKGKLKTEIVGDGEEIEVEEGEDLSKGDLDMIYQRAQKGDKTMKEMEPADTFNMTLRGYQKQALCWMQSLESGKMDVRDAASMHPLWSEYVFPQKADGDIIDLTEDDQPFYFNAYSGELSLKFPRAERNCRGGILADVGMGKTIMLSALIHTSLPSENDLPVEDDPAPSRKRQLKLNAAFKPVRKRPTKPPSATLIVAPTSLLSQWAEEMERSSKPGTAKVLVWHGQNRLDLEAAVEDDDDDDKLKIIITSYGVLVSEHARSEKSRSPVFELEWLRVVLDEAHACKSRASRTAKAVYALRAQRRWAVTGTPIVNKLEDLFSLLKFINFKPWSDFTFFRSFITVPFLDRDPKAIEVVQVILESVLLRREKNMRDADGNKIVDLPSKEVAIRTLEFSMAERRIYDAIYQGVKKNFERLSAKGLIGKNYTHILAMLMKLRRAVLHPSLVLDAEDGRGVTPAGDGFVDVNEILKSIKADEEESAESSGSNAFAKDVLANLNENETGECPICLDVMDRPMIVPECMHQCCKDCILMFITTCEQKGQEPGCPTCGQRPIKANKLIEVVRNPSGDSTQANDGPAEVVLRKNDFESSRKIDALLEHLSRLRDQDPCFRAVVFSQFTSFMDLIEKALRRERFDSHRYDGSMDVKKRSAAINAFKENSREPKVLVISLKAGGVGLNLTNANHVFMMDCWWNAATENQAIDRVHRLGQDKTVYVTHFIISNTIEGRILQIQKRKTAIVKEAFRGTQANGSGEKESVENLKIIFGDDE